MNGAASHLIKKDHEIIIMGFELVENPELHTYTTILVELQEGRNVFKKFI
jgi:aspartate 1-decarboxylase